MPTLKTARLTLMAPLLYEGMDVSHHLRWLNSPQVVQYSEQRHKIHTQESQFEYLLTFNHLTSYIWEIHYNGSGSGAIGTITAHLDGNNWTANMGIMIGEKRIWGQGYGPEAWEAVSNWLFDEGTRKIEAGCMACNTPMIRILEKTGFDLEAEISGHFLLNGKPEDMLLYGKTRQAKIVPIKSGPKNGTKHAA